MSFDQSRDWKASSSGGGSSESGRSVPLRIAVASGLLLAIAMVGSPSEVVAETLGFDITVSFTGGLTLSQQAIFGQAAATWESVILGYQPDTLLKGVSITAQGASDDGVGGRLGFAGPTNYFYQGGFRFATKGSMTFDSDDLTVLENSGRLCDVIKHEMGHVLGFGTLWGSNEVSSAGTGQYTGAAALAAYQSEFNQPNATFVPVELGGGTGTANYHWDEGDGGALTGITDRQGRDMRNELMTGWLNTSPFLSETTIQSFADIGYVVVPEPSVLAMLLGMALVSSVWRARKQFSHVK